MHTPFRRRYILGILVLLLELSWPIMPATAAGTTTSSGAVIQSYSADSSVLPSMLVELKPKDKTTVIPLINTDLKAMLGVVVPRNNATLVLTPQNVSTQQVLVAPSGRYNVLISNQNGAIKTGDYLSISDLPGIAMKANPSQALIIGRAASNFNGSNSISTTTLKNSQNSNIKVSIGNIPVILQLAPSPLYLQNSNSIFVFLSRAEYAVNNKPASPVKTYLVGLVAVATILTTGVVLYAGTRTSIIAVGRNPLAKRAVSRSMLKTIIAGLLVFATGVSVVYLLLN